MKHFQRFYVGMIFLLCIAALMAPAILAKISSNEYWLCLYIPFVAYLFGIIFTLKIEEP